MYIIIHVHTYEVVLYSKHVSRYMQLGVFIQKKVEFEKCSISNICFENFDVISKLLLKVTSVM